MRVRVLVLVSLCSCGGPPADDGGGGSTGAAGSSGGTSAAPTTGAATTSTSTSTTSGESSGEPATTGAPTTGGTSTGESTGTSTGTGTEDSGEESTTTGDFCDGVLDVVSHNYVKTVDNGLTGLTGAYYNAAKGELVFLSATGPGRRAKLSGDPIGVVAAPPEVAPGLDGAAYDAAGDVALLIDQDCELAEVDPVTLELLSLEVVDPVEFGLQTCSGIAVGPGGDLFLTSQDSDEVVVVSRDLADEVRRWDLAADGLTGPDGIARVAGSDNVLVVGSDGKAAIYTHEGVLVVPASDIGGGLAPLVGGGPLAAPDALTSVCVNGQAWLCEGGQGEGCRQFAPEGGGADVCACTP